VLRKNDEVPVSFVSYRPGPPLNEFVEYVWLIEGGQAPRLEKILPSATIELVVNLKNDEIHIHDPEQPDQFKVFSGAVFSGTYQRSFICNAQQHEAILGVHFKAGGAFPFLGAEASELTNAHANLLDLWGRSGLELRERLYTASIPQERFRIIDATLRNRLQNHTNGQFPIPIARKIFAMVGNRVSIREISRELGFSQRRFIQIFNSFVGLNPKVFYRIQRFQRARVLAERRPISNWAELAVTCGYFDQSHLIKDFKEFSGSTPRIYSVQQEHKDARFKDNHVPLK
jgi:AraC-like DNA-binding protein